MMPSSYRQAMKVSLEAQLRQNTARLVSSVGHSLAVWLRMG